MQNMTIILMLFWHWTFVQINDDDVVDDDDDPDENADDDDDDDGNDDDVWHRNTGELWSWPNKQDLQQSLPSNSKLAAAEIKLNVELEI